MQAKNKQAHRNTKPITKANNKQAHRKLWVLVQANHKRLMKDRANNLMPNIVVVCVGYWN